MKRGLACVMASAVLMPLLAAPAFAQQRERRIDISPYLELNQALVANLSGGDDGVMAYTGAAAGVDARITTRDAEGQVSLRYEHQFGWAGNAADQDIISGIVRGRVMPIADTLTIEGGAIGTRTRADLRGAGGFLSGSDPVAKVYSAYVGPAFATRAGDLNINAAYRLGYSRVTNDLGGPFGLDTFDDSLFQSATASVGVQPGPLPVGLAVSAGWDREDAKILDQRFDDKWARGDVTVPVSASTALVGGIGYERLKIGQRDYLRDANGDPVISSKGRLVTDNASPRTLAYDFDGLLWDVGVLWRPSRRTSLEARVGERYGSWRFTGSFSWQPSRDSSLRIVVFDGIDSFGRMMNGALAGLGTEFEVVRNPFTGDLNNCVYGAQGGGQCFADALSAISAANFRHRGIAFQYTVERGPWNWGVAGGYSRRKFIAPTGDLFVNIDGAVDENYYLNMILGRRIDQRSGIDATVYANYYDGGRTGGVDVLNAGAYASYYRNLTRRLTGTASVGIDGVDPDGIDSIISALGQVSLRYQF